MKLTDENVVFPYIREIIVIVKERGSGPHHSAPQITQIQRACQLVIHCFVLCIASEKVGKVEQNCTSVGVTL